jgi:hypothetical protein
MDKMMYMTSKYKTHEINDWKLKKTHPGKVGTLEKNSKLAQTIMAVGRERVS